MSATELELLLKEFGKYSQRLISGCRIAAHDGTALYTPDGVASYNALWVRDFEYMVEYAGEFIPDGELRAGIEYLLGGVRADGWAPDRVDGTGRAVYTAGPADAPVGRENLDNGPFLVLLAGACLDRLPPAEAQAVFHRWFGKLDRAMAVLPLSPRGLIYNDPADPHSPYGFTDNVAKTGELFMESVLWWRGCDRLARMLKRFGGDPAAANRYEQAARRVEENIGVLRVDSLGAYAAATVDCRQLDIWAIAYALYVGFPLPRREEMIDLFVRNRGDYVWRGQVKHLPGKETWQRLLIPVAPGEYQNGAYWATAAGWVLWVLAQRDPALALQMARDLLDYFRQEEVYECVNGPYQKLPSYVVSATNPYGALKRLLAPPVA